jgi:hypothetical protein
MNDELNAIPSWDLAAWEKVQAAIPAMKEAQAKAEAKARDDVIRAATEYAKTALDTIQKDPCCEQVYLPAEKYPPLNDVTDVLKKTGFVVVGTPYSYLVFDFVKRPSDPAK